MPASDRSSPFKNPFNKNSAHHRPIGSTARYAGNAHAGTVDWLKGNVFYINIGNPSGTDVVEVDETDPFRVIGGASPCDTVVGMPVTLRLPIEGFDNASTRPDGGCPDNVAVIFDLANVANPADDVLHQLRQYDWNNGSPVAQKRWSWNIRGLGHGTRPGERIASAASGVAGLFGVLRGFEINTPGYKIQHALQMGLPRKEGRGCNVMLSADVVLPATERDTNYFVPGNNTGHIPYGALLAIRANVNITQLGLSEAGLRLAAAMQDYGMYVSNGGGCQSATLDGDQEISPTLGVALRDDIQKIYPYVRRVMNNDVLGSPTAGGGTPRAANCAFDAP